MGMKNILLQKVSFKFCLIVPINQKSPFSTNDNERQLLLLSYINVYGEYAFGMKYKCVHI